MEFIERSPEKIIIREKGYSGWLMALITWLILTILPLSLLDLLSVDKFSCRRIEPQRVNCQTDSQHWLGIGDVQSTLYPSVEIITKEEQKTDEGKIYYDYYIRTKQGKFYISFNDSERTLVNRFLENSDEQYIKIDIFTQEDALSVAIFLVLFSFPGFLAGLIILARAYKSKIYIFDDSTRRFMIQTEKYRKTITKEYSFEKIRSLYINESSNDNDDNIYSLSRVNQRP